MRRRRRTSQEIRTVTRRKQPGAGEARKKKAVKKKARRKARKVKPVRDKENPVKIVFQCYYGVVWSKEMAEAFETYLKDKNLSGLFKIQQAGVKHTPTEYKETPRALLARWRKMMREADFVVAMTPELYKAGKFKIPADVKPIYTIRHGVFVPDNPKTPVEPLFDAILGKAKKKFNLVLPKKKKKGHE